MKKIWVHILGLLLGFYTVEVYATVTVAVIVPKAGVHAAQGAELEQGAEFAVAQINADGGLLKQKVKILPIDDQCSDNIAVSTAQMLSLAKQQKVSLVIGPYCSNAFEEVADIYAKAGILQIIPTTVSSIFQDVRQKGLIKMLGYSSQQAESFFKYYNKHFAGESVALIVNLEDAESNAVAEAVRDEFQKHGKSVMLKNYTYQDTGKEEGIKYDILAAKIVAEGSKIAYVTGTAKNIRKIVRYLKSEWSDFIVFTDRYAVTAEYFDYLGSAAEGTYFMSLSGQKSDPDLVEEMVHLRLSGFEAEGLALYGYSAVKIWEALVRKNGTFDYAKIAKKINSNKVKTNLGSYYFRAGAPYRSEDYIIVRYTNGTFDKVD